MKKKKLKILFHPNTTQWLDFYYLAKKLSKNHDIYFIIWNEDLLKLINQYNNKFKVIVYKNPTFWKISKYINQIKKRSFLKKIILNLKDYFFIKKLFAKKKFDILISVFVYTNNCVNIVDIINSCIPIELWPRTSGSPTSLSPLLGCTHGISLSRTSFH